MNLLISSSRNPYINLATEEFLLKQSNEDHIFLYINQPCVVVGKHQIAQKEINSKYANDNNILIARRISGGGAVYHDPGNLNISFIKSISSPEDVSYKKIAQPIFDFLESIGITFLSSEKNDLLFEGRKISGSAMHIFKDRILAHCTLLVNSDLTHLSKSLRGNPERYTDKSIGSRRAKVMNLSAIDKKIEIDLLESSFGKFLFQKSICTTSLAIPDSFNEVIHELAANKYSTNDWIYGYSPRYIYTSVLTDQINSEIFIIEVEKGIIVNANINSVDEVNLDMILIVKELIGLKHNFIELNQFLNSKSDSLLSQKLLDALF